MFNTWLNLETALSNGHTFIPAIHPEKNRSDSFVKVKLFVWRLRVDHRVLSGLFMKVSRCTFTPQLTAISYENIHQFERWMEEQHTNTYKLHFIKGWGRSFSPSWVLFQKADFSGSKSEEVLLKAFKIPAIIFRQQLTKWFIQCVLHHL